MRRGLGVASIALVLVVANAAIFGNERLLSSGRVVILELAPVDPRSLMQGDYMRLAFAVADPIVARARSASAHRGALVSGEDGRIVLAPDARGVARFVRIDDGSPLAANEVAMRYRIRGREVKLATNAYFFEEGQAKRFEVARYGEFRVGTGGKALLTGLRDGELQPIPARERK